LLRAIAATHGVQVVDLDDLKLGVPSRRILLCSSPAILQHRWREVILAVLAWPRAVNDTTIRSCVLVLGGVERHLSFSGVGGPDWPASAGGCRPVPACTATFVSEP
jgi:hypothetical protein